MSTTPTVTTSEAIECGFICVNELSDVLKRVFCASLWNDPQFYRDAVYTAYEQEIDGMCSVLQFLNLAREVKSEPCKIVLDEETGNYRLAEPDEVDLADEGVLVHWEATQALMEMIQQHISVK
jgi:hypothetical protein